MVANGVSGPSEPLPQGNTRRLSIAAQRPMSDAATGVPESRLLRVKQAAEYTGSTIWFIRSQIWSGNLPYVQMGKRFLIDRADLDTLIDKLKQTAM